MLWRRLSKRPLLIMQRRKKEARLLPRSPPRLLNLSLPPRPSLLLPRRNKRPQPSQRLRLRLQPRKQRSQKPPPRRTTKETVAAPS